MIGPILHLAPTEAGQSVWERLQQIPEATESVIQMWLKFGCIYLNGNRLSQEEEKTQLVSSDILKIHTTPKRFPIDRLKVDALLFEDDWLIAIHKPPGVPGLPVASNAIENCKYVFEQSHGQSLFPLHRLDEGTEGILLFAKSPELVEKFHRDNEKGKVSKVYKALTKTEVPLGEHTHYLKKVPGKMQCLAWPEEDAKEAKLRVLSSKRQSKNSEQFESEILLITGRTHQIRCQLSFLGAPIIGDNLYGIRSEGKRLELKAYSLGWAGYKPDTEDLQITIE